MIKGSYIDRKVYPCPIWPLSLPLDKVTANSFVTVLTEPALYEILPSYAPNIISIFHCLGLSKQSVHFRQTIFYGEELLAPRPTPMMEEHPLSVVRDWLLNISGGRLLHRQSEDTPWRGYKDPHNLEWKIHVPNSLFPILHASFTLIRFGIAQWHSAGLRTGW